MPLYVFVNLQWNGVISDNLRILQWGPNNGAMFTLGPDDEKNLNGNKLFPAGFCSIVHPYWLFNKIHFFNQLEIKIIEFKVIFTSFG